MSSFDARRHLRQRGEPPVTIVGGGPAGLSCAIVLARAGRGVVAHEWRDRVGHRFQGDFQGLENWSGSSDVLDELADIGIAPTFEYWPVSQATAFDSRGGRYSMQSQRPIYYLVRRGRHAGSLDQALLQQAVAAGVEVRYADRIHATDGPAVLATGPRIADAIVVGYVFETDMPDGDWLVLDNNLAPLGYAYPHVCAWSCRH